jgi:co-chaperonin GroES (HSP10)
MATSRTTEPDYVDVHNAFGSPENIPEGLPSFREKERIIPPKQEPYEVKAEKQIDKLPTPQGWKILIVPYTQPTVSKGGIHIPDVTVRAEEIATSIGYVVAVGPLAYKDEAKFGGIPWCKKGDYVVFGRYAGSRLIMRAEDNNHLPIRLLNDDEILAVLPNPQDYVGVS